MVDGPYLPLSHWADIVTVFEEGSKNARHQAGRLAAAWGAWGEVGTGYYLGLFLTGKSEPRKNMITDALADHYPELAERLGAEQDRVAQLVERRNGIICRDRTAALVTIAVEVIRRYTDEKERRGLLDYDDLIDKTHRLLADVDQIVVVEETAALLLDGITPDHLDRDRSEEHTSELQSHLN